MTAKALLAVAALGLGHGVVHRAPNRPSAPRLTFVNASLEGELTIQFHGAAPGCLRDGVCGYSGTAVLHATEGDLSDQGGLMSQTSQAPQVVLIVDSSNQMSIIVHRTAAGGIDHTCAESSTVDLGATAIVGGSRTAIIRAADAESGLLSSRCASPLYADVASALPSASASLAQLRRGRGTISLEGTRGFSAGGFAGTVISTLRITLLGTESPGSSTGGGGPTALDRTVSVPVKVSGGAGSLHMGFAGVTDPDTCAVLDSCGMLGEDLISVSGSTQGEVSVTGPARRPLRDFLTALGLARGGRTNGLYTFGLLGPLPLALSSVARQDTSCQDGPAHGSGVVAIVGAGSRAGIELANLDDLRTRCPGPLISAGVSALLGGGNSLLAAAFLPGNVLARRSFKVRLMPSWPRSDDGYSLARAGSTTVTIQAGRPRITTQRVSTS